MSRAQRSADRLCRNQPPSRLLASRLLASCLLASSLWGCPDAEPDPDAGPYVPMGEARIEIGTGSSEFVPLLADSTLELIA
ncbi:MAG: hypothetical protein OEY14_10675, partial [Myxococcales bacterium]|nr:hypothetical protein [Myxococcales bacterium]